MKKQFNFWQITLHYFCFVAFCFGISTLCHWLFPSVSAETVYIQTGIALIYIKASEVNWRLS